MILFRFAPALIALLAAPSMAQEGMAPDMQRAVELGAAAHAAALVFDGNPIIAMIAVDEGTYRVSSDTCTVEIGITLAYDELDPLAPPDPIADTRTLECSGQ